MLKSEAPYVYETAAKFARMEPKVRSHIIATVTQRLDDFRSPDIAFAFSAE
jgi:hypothetical protein